MVQQMTAQSPAHNNSRSWRSLDSARDRQNESAERYEKNGAQPLQQFLERWKHMASTYGLPLISSFLKKRITFSANLLYRLARPPSVPTLERGNQGCPLFASG